MTSAESPMMRRFSTLVSGDTFSKATLQLDAETVRRYLIATDDDNSIYWENGVLHLVPPLAVAALAFQGIAQEVALEPGSLHTGQEVRFRRPVQIDEHLYLDAYVATSSKRRGFTALAIETTALDSADKEALGGRMMLLVAASDEAIRPVEEISPSFPINGVEPRPYAPLEQIGEGVDLPPLTRTMSQEVIDMYAAASGDYNPIHIDPLFARSSPFGGTVAHGMLLLAGISLMLTRAFGDQYLTDSTLRVRFRSPVLAGTTVTTRGAIERIERIDGVEYAVCAVALERADGDVIISGEARIKIALPITT